MPEDTERTIKPSHVQIYVTRLEGDYPIFGLQYALRNLAEKLEFWASREVVWQQDAPLPIELEASTPTAAITLKIRKAE